MKVILEMLSYPFLVRALVVGVLVSLCASLLGVSLVLKRYSMIGDGLSHVGVGALAWAVRCVADAISASCCSTLSVLTPTLAMRAAVPWSLVSSDASDRSAVRISRSAPFSPRASSLLVPAASC